MEPWEGVVEEVEVEMELEVEMEMEVEMEVVSPPPALLRGCSSDV